MYPPGPSDRPPTEAMFEEDGLPPMLRNAPPSRGRHSQEIETFEKEIAGVDGGDVAGGARGNENAPRQSDGRDGFPGVGGFPPNKRGLLPLPDTSRQLFPQEHLPEQGWSQQPVPHGGLPMRMGPDPASSGVGVEENGVARESMSLPEDEARTREPANRLGWLHI